MKHTLAYPLVIACVFGVASPLVRAQSQDQAEEGEGGLLANFLQDTLSTDSRYIKVRGLEGALSSKATIQQITVSDEDGVWLTIDNAVLDWNRLALLRGRFSVNELTAAEISVARAPEPVPPDPELPSPEAQPFQVPELPVSVEIGKIGIDKLALGEPLLGLAADLSLTGALSLADGELDTDLDITRLDRPGDTASLTASFQNENNTIGLDLKIVEDQGGLISKALKIPGEPPLLVTAKGDGPVTDFTADLGLTSDDTQRIAGQVRLRGLGATATDDSSGIRFTADIGGDVTPLLAEEFDPFFGTETRLFVDGRTKAEGAFDIPEFEVTTEALHLSGELSLAAGGKLNKAALQGRITPPGTQPVVLPIAEPRTTLDAAQLSLLYDAANGDLWDLSLTARDLQTPELKLGRARLTAQGTFSQGDVPELDGDLQALLDGIAFSDPSLQDAIGNRITLDGLFGLTGEQSLKLSNFELFGSDYTLSVDTVIDGLNSGFEMDGSAALTASDLSRFSGLANMDLAGEVIARLAGTGSPLGGSFDGQLEMQGRNLATGRADIDPLIIGETTIALDAVRDSQGLTIRKATLAGTALRAEAAAKVSQPDGKLTVDGNARVNAPDLSVFSALAGYDLGGAVDASVTGKGTPETLEFDGKAEITGQNLKTGLTEIDPVIAGQTLISLDAARTGDQIVVRKAVVNADALDADVVATVTDPTGVMSVEGQAQLDAPDLSVFSGLAGFDLGGSITADAQGSATVKSLLFDLKLDVKASDLKTGIEKADALIEGRTTLTMDASRDAQGLDIRTFDLDGTALSASARGDLREENGSLTVEAALDNLARVSSTITGPLTLNGDVTPTGKGIKGDIRLTGPDTSFAHLVGTAETKGDADFDFDARLDRIERFLPEFPGSATAKGNAKRKNGVWTVDASAAGPANIETKVAGTFDEGTGLADMSATGGVNIGIANRFITPNKIAGSARYDLALKGNPGLDALSGTISTSGTTFAIPNAGQTLTNIGGTVTLASSRATLALNGQGRNGGGFSVSGPVSLNPPFDGQISTSINQFVLTDKLLYETTLNGQIVMSGPLAGNSALAGQIEFGETNINLAAASGAVGAAPIPPMQHVGESGPVYATLERANLIKTGNGQDKSSRISLDISLNAPNRVFVRGRGVNAELGGKLHIGGSTAKVVPSGQIELIRGTFDILARRLNLTKGLVTLQGNLTPYLEFASTATTSDGTATIEISGPLNAPEIEVYADPERPAEEALAMLLFGNEFSQLSPFVIAQMAASLAQLSGVGGDATKGVREKTGLSNIELAPASGGGGLLGAGGYLGENLYTDFTVNTQGETEVNLNLDVTDNLTVRGTVDGNGETGIGVFFERDY